MATLQPKHTVCLYPLTQTCTAGHGYDSSPTLFVTLYLGFNQLVR